MAVVADSQKDRLDDPSFRWDYEASGAGSLHDLQLPCACTREHVRHYLVNVSTLRKDAFNKREQSLGSIQQRKGAVTVLRIGGMNSDI